MSVNDRKDDAKNLMAIQTIFSPRNCFFDENWSWNKHDRGPDVYVYGSGRSCMFHPGWSHGTSAIRGNMAFKDGIHYWEVDVSHRIFGTSLMFGLGTRRASLHKNCFTNLIGGDSQSWGLSHKGLLWHDGQSVAYVPPFLENTPTTIGVLVDTQRSTVTYFKDGHCLGTAFTGLDFVEADLFPMISSSASRTQMTLSITRRSFDTLQDRCCWQIVRRLRTPRDVEQLVVPCRLQEYLRSRTTWVLQ